METFLKVIEGSALTTSTKQTRLYEHIADKGGLISIGIYKLILSLKKGSKMFLNLSFVVEKLRNIDLAHFWGMGLN